MCQACKPFSRMLWLQWPNADFSWQAAGSGVNQCGNHQPRLSLIHGWCLTPQGAKLRPRLRMAVSKLSSLLRFCVKVWLCANPRQVLPRWCVDCTVQTTLYYWMLHIFSAVGVLILQDDRRILNTLWINEGNFIVWVTQGSGEITQRTLSGLNSRKFITLLALVLLRL